MLELKADARPLTTKSFSFSNVCETTFFVRPAIESKDNLSMADRRRLPAIYDRVDDDTIEVQGQVDESSDSNVEDVPDEDGLRSKCTSLP